jgi:hypothetical protein
MVKIKLTKKDSKEILIKEISKPKLKEYLTQREKRKSADDIKNRKIEVSEIKFQFLEN